MVSSVGYTGRNRTVNMNRNVLIECIFFLFVCFYREVRKRSDNQDDTRSVTSLAGTPVKKSALTKNCCNV